jgi:DNA invertase Pin-like site-specific DNA recombinase
MTDERTERGALEDFVRGTDVWTKWDAARRPLAAVARHEREIISARKSAALKAAKARGKRLGNPKLADARRHAATARKEGADRYSANVLPVIQEIQRSGIKSLRGIARALAARGIPTARGGAWTAVQVSDILRRAARNLFAVGALIE